MTDAVAKPKSQVKKIVRPIFPNAGVRAWYERQLVDLLTQSHLDIALVLSLALHETPPKLLAADAWMVKHNPGHGGMFSMPEHWYIDPVYLAQDAKSPIINIDRTLKTWANKWTLKFDKLSLDLSKKFATKAFGVTETAIKAAFKASGFTVKFQPTRAGLEAYRAVVAENVNLIKSIPQEYLTDVQSSVWTSVKSGGNMGTLSRKLHKNYEVSVKRAALIARDQNAKATAVIENTRRQQLGIKTAVWQHSSGGKEPRPAHVAMNGKTFALSKGMWDEDEGEWIFPGQLINCRCTSRAVIPGFED